MTDMTLLITLGYVTYSIVAFIKGDEIGRIFLKGLTEMYISGLQPKCLRHVLS
jgi:hypothetical protein